MLEIRKGPGMALLLVVRVVKAVKTKLADRSYFKRKIFLLSMEMTMIQIQSTTNARCSAKVWQVKITAAT